MIEQELLIAHAIRSKASALGSPIDAGTAEAFAQAALDALFDLLIVPPEAVPAG